MAGLRNFPAFKVQCTWSALCVPAFPYRLTWHAEKPVTKEKVVPMKIDEARELDLVR